MLTTFRLTRNGHGVTALISPDDLAQLEETIDVLSDPQRGSHPPTAPVSGEADYELALTPPARQALAGNCPSRLPRP
jgi:hypothetical protein